MPELIRPLQQRREDEMKDLRKRAADGSKSALKALHARCRAGMLVPYWER